MKRSKRSPYTRIATDADKQRWKRVFAPIALIGFVPVAERSNVVHWAAIVRSQGIRTKHTLHGLCDCRVVANPTPTAEVNCMTCIVRIEQGPSDIR